MEKLPNLTIVVDDEDGLILEIEGTELFDYVEEFLIDHAPVVYSHIDDVEMNDDFSLTRIYFSDEIDSVMLEKSLETIDRTKLTKS